jgi:predicted glutamine amidotransferase
MNPNRVQLSVLPAFYKKFLISGACRTNNFKERRQIMCVIIWKPEHKRISEDTLYNCYATNPDGIGFAVAIDNELKVSKGFLTFESFYKEYKTIENFPVLIHFRLATHGSINSEMCHPFVINNNLAMAHNGILKDFAFEKSELSDTAHFIQYVIKPLHMESPDFHLDRGKEMHLKKLIGSYNKLAFLDAFGRVTLVNVQKGVWIDGCWFSNDLWKISFVDDWLECKESTCNPEKIFCDICYEDYYEFQLVECGAGHICYACFFRD